MQFFQPLKLTDVEEPFVYLVVAGGMKRRNANPSPVGGRPEEEFDKGLIETDAHREGSVCLVVAGGSKRRKLDACEPKANGSRRMLRTGAVTADKASTVLLGHLGTHNITFFTWSVVSVRISSGKFKNSRISFLCIAWKMRKCERISSNTCLFPHSRCHRSGRSDNVCDLKFSKLCIYK